MGTPGSSVAILNGLLDWGAGGGGGFFPEPATLSVHDEGVYIYNTGTNSSDGRHQAVREPRWLVGGVRGGGGGGGRLIGFCYLTTHMPVPITFVRHGSARLGLAWRRARLVGWWRLWEAASACQICRHTQTHAVPTYIHPHIMYA